MKPNYIVIIAVVVIISFIAGWCISVFAKRVGAWESVIVQLDSDTSLEVRRKHAHPFLAEFEREVVIIDEGKRFEALSYPYDSGGGFPMTIRFYEDAARRVVRLTDRYLYDRLIDLKTGQFVGDETPPEGKELTSFIREDALPSLKRSIEIGKDLKPTEKKAANLQPAPTRMDDSPVD